MKSLVVASQKGGVGKTTVALNLAFALSRRRHRILLVDTDPQGAVGLSLARRSGHYLGLADYQNTGKPLERLVLATRLKELQILLNGRLAAENLDRFVQEIQTGPLLDRLLTEAEERYDLVVFDTPSGLSGVSKGVMRRASHLLSPLQAEPVSLRSVDQLLRTVDLLQRQGSRIELAALLLYMLQVKNETSVRVAREVWASFPSDFVLETTVPRHPAFLAATEAGVPVGLLADPPPPIAGLFDQLAAELELRLELLQEVPDEQPIHLLV